jgi:hypothetical protein
MTIKEDILSFRPTTALALLVLTIVGLFVTLYVSSPSGFVVTVYPDTQIDVCLENGSLVLDQSRGIVPSYSWTETSHRGIYIKELNLIFDENSIGFEETISITDLDGPRWALGRVVKPYRKQVTLVLESGLPGVNVAFAGESFSAEILDHSRVNGTPPFNAKIILKIARNSTLEPGPHYLTIKGIGQDGKIETCQCVLMVNRFCKNRFIVLNLQ